MELKLEVNAEELNNEIRGIFSSLTEDDKRDIAKQVITHSFTKMLSNDNKHWDRSQFVKSLESAITSEISVYLKEKIADEDAIKKTLDVVIGVVEKNFPSFVQNALTSWFVGNLSTVQMGMSAALQNNESHRVMLDEIARQLNITQY